MRFEYDKQFDFNSKTEEAVRSLLLRSCIGIMNILIVSMIAFVIATPLAFAEGAGEKPSAGKATKRTAVNFEDQLIEGQTQKPELFYLLQQRNNNYKRLIRLRENFLPEMRKTAEDMSR